MRMANKMSRADWDLNDPRGDVHSQMRKIQSKLEKANDKRMESLDRIRTQAMSQYNANY